MRSYRVLAGLCLAVFCLMTGMGMAGAALPAKFLAVGGDVRSAGGLAAAFALAYIVCQYPAGRLADAFGATYVVAAGFALTAVSALVCREAGTASLIYLSRFLQGAGEAPVWACAPVLLAAMYPHMRGRVIGMYNAAFHCGMMLGPALAAGLSGFGAVDPFLLFAGLGFAGCVLVLVSGAAAPSTRPSDAGQAASRPEPVLEDDEASTGNASALLSRLAPALLGLPVFGASYGLLTSCVPLSLAATRGFGERELGVFFFVAFAALTLAQLAAGRLSDRFGRRGFMGLGLALMAVGLWMVAGEAELSGGGLFAGAGILGAGLGGFGAPSMALLQESCASRLRGRAAGFYYAVWGLGYFAGPLAADAAGLDLVAGSIGALGCFAVCVMAAIVALPRAARPRGGEKAGNARRIAENSGRLHNG